MRFDGAPVLVTAARQTAGRGRSGRTWVHADRAVAASVALALDWGPDDLGVVPLVAGLAAAATFDARLKWPNDLIADGRKAGGILVESSDATVVIGMGVNLWWPEPIEGAGAVFAADPGPNAPTRLAEVWARDMVARLALGPGAWGRDEYERLCETIGRDITWHPAGAGLARGVDERGRLVVDTPDGVAILDSGEVRHVR